MSDKASYTVKAEAVKGMAAVFKGNDTVTIVATGTGWSIASVSADHVSMMRFTAPRHMFDTYVEGSTFTLGLKDIEMMARMRCEKVSITLDDGKAVIATEDGAKMKVKVPLYVPDDSLPKIPDLNMDSSFEMASDDLADCLGIAKSLNPVSVRFSTDICKDSVTVSSGGAVEGREVSMTYETRVESNGYNVSSAFGFDYVADFIKAVGKGGLAFELSEDFPVRITADRGWVASILIAPRIEEA